MLHARQLFVSNFQRLFLIDQGYARVARANLSSPSACLLEIYEHAWTKKTCTRVELEAHLQNSDLQRVAETMPGMHDQTLDRAIGDAELLISIRGTTPFLMSPLVPGKTQDI